MTEHDTWVGTFDRKLRFLAGSFLVVEPTRKGRWKCKIYFTSTRLKSNSDHILVGLLLKKSSIWRSDE